MRTAVGAFAADSSLELPSKEGSSSELQIKLHRYIPMGKLVLFFKLA